MEEIAWYNKLIEYLGNNPILSSVVVPALVGFVTTGFMSFARRPKKVSQGGEYFTNAAFLNPPMERPAYSDRMAYVLAEMSALAYFEFEGSAGALQQAVDRFLEISGAHDSDAEARVRELLKSFRDDLLIKSVDSRKFLGELLKTSGFELLDTINIADTQAFICRRSKRGEAPYLVVAYRGTEKDVGDWLTDADAIPVHDPETGTKVHKGFLTALTQNRDENGKTVLDRVKEAVEGNRAKSGKNRAPCFFTGHSLGGALALMTTREIGADIHGACYTFGAPRVANYEYFKDMKTPVFRVVNSSDIVPRVPPGAVMGVVLKLVQGLGWVTRFIPLAKAPLEWLEHKVDQLNGYRHYGDQRYLTDIKAGAFKDVRLLSNPPLIDRIWWMWQHIRKSFLEPVRSHGMAIYRKKLLCIATSRNGSQVQATAETPDEETAAD